MTEVLAQKDAYLKEFEAVITAVGQDEGTGDREAVPRMAVPRAIALDRTAFFPGGGGQPPDLGWIAEIPVVRVKRQGEWI